MGTDGITQFMTALSIWTGASLGGLKILDWLLSDRAKRKIAGIAETAWVWLSDQRAGKFTVLVKSARAQRWFVLFAHSSMVFITLSFLARVYLNIHVNADLQLGHPRIYHFQIWVDVAALLFSAAFLSWRFHPKIAARIASATSLRGYFGRCLKAWGVCLGLLLLLLVVEYPLVGFSSPAFRYDTLAEVRTAYEHMLGGKAGVVTVHAATAFLAAPIMAEMLILQTILFLSLYWVLVVWFVIILFRGAQFILIRVVESPDGPILAVSGLLIGAGALAKAFLD